MNATIEKFGYPGSLVATYRHWLVLLRPAQATLGALVLASVEPARALSEVSAEGFVELAKISADIETALGSAFGHDKLNYLMLMMVDPDVHFHVLPRYSGERQFHTSVFTDPGWPGPPRLDHANAPDPACRDAILATLREHWPTASR